MSPLAHASRKLLASAVLALSMAVGLSSMGAGGAAAAESSPRSVVGKSDVGKITSTVVGRTSNGDKVTGSFTPIRTVERDGVLYMKGFLRGVIQDAGPNTKFSGVQSIPIKKINGSPLANGRVAANAAACDILNLVLGPLDLNLLGLEIHLQRVVLDIVAVAGAGNLLGNLLCAVAGLLDGGPLAGLLGQLQTLLNQILAALNLGV
ncbi:ABC transporter substrate-binding protein [Microbacterium sp. ARD31]|uniref:ABC transporter substrate-binding protein n=1 Tax=Microbacterium sp. ARD31 TaxID=2962576 RepID=UPI0028821AF6|nr:ABC transporter substrate-binding protein [Microbacterium sp. ARD31]MDT0183464.1 ABC transporter substrate-binding protein [Microbacterium sp. ARD31]